MKLRGLLIASLVLVILAGVLYWSQHHTRAAQSAPSQTTASPMILNVDSPAITRLTIKKKGAEPVTILRNAGNWQIVEPKPLGADQNAVANILSSLSALNAERVIEDKAVNLSQYGLDQPAIEVDITEKDQKTQKVLLGDATPTDGAVYAMLAGNPRVFTTSSSNKTGLDKSLNDLRDKRLVTLDPDKIVRLELTRKTQNVEFDHNKADWQIVKPEPLRTDSFSVDDLVRKITGARMDLSDSGEKDAAAFARATPVATVKVSDKSSTQVLQVRKNKDEYFAKSSAVDGDYKVDSDLGQALDKGLADFRNKKLFDFNFSNPNRIELHTGSKAYSFTRSGDDWFSNGRKMDAQRMESLVSKLRDLTATKFPDSGSSKPEIVVTVTSDDGKRVEKVAISKAGDHYIAKRENEPFLYQLDSSSVEDLQKTADQTQPTVPARK